jgi:DNA segregation ATPase FtsK/SpoIIIE-like protein
MVIATQRPSVDVITGLIKANIPSRLALAVASQTDSRTILDAGGAEKLVGRGDMLFLPASQGKPSRMQGCWVTEEEIASVVSFCRTQREPAFEEAVAATVSGASTGRVSDGARGDDEGDAGLLRRAAEQVVSSGLGSTSMLQRKLRIGFARAGRLMDELEEVDCVGPLSGVRSAPAELAVALGTLALELATERRDPGDDGQAHEPVEHEAELVTLRRGDRDALALLRRHHDGGRALVVRARRGRQGEGQQHRDGHERRQQHREQRTGGGVRGRVHGGGG